VDAWPDHTINGIVIGSIHALIAVGLALIYGVASLVT
jgi:branched-chain amino acid transport system permease protein